MDVDMTTPPTVYVIAGPNGAGKTTFATEFLPSFVNCQEFVNADLIAAGLSPFAPEGQSLPAGRLMLSRITELTLARKTFSFETTLAGIGYARLLADMREAGYQIHLYFLWLPNAEFAITRVAERVSKGGHHVPASDVRRRFARGIANFLQLYRPLADDWWLFDGSTMPPRQIARSINGSLLVINRELFQRVEVPSEGSEV